MEADVDVEAKVLSAVQIAAERNREATALRDAGKVDEAKQLLLRNALDLGRISEFSLINKYVCLDVELGCKLNTLQSAVILENYRFHRS